MIDFLKLLTTILQEIHPQTFHERNNSKSIAYPYVTFNFDSEPIRRNQDGFYLDLDLFDNSKSARAIFELEDKLKDGLVFNRTGNDKVFLAFNFLGSNKVPTGDTNLKRRNVRFYVAVDWRKKQYGTT